MFLTQPGEPDSADGGETHASSDESEGEEWNAGTFEGEMRTWGHIEEF